MVAHPVLFSVLLGIGIAAIGVIDYRSGPDVGFSLFYIVPIAYAGWRGPRAAAVALAGVATLAWTFADFGWHGVNLVSAWNAFTRFFIYMGFAWLTARVRGDREQLVSLNRQLSDLLAEEEQRARSDVLTGLPNRRMFMDELARATARCRRSGQPMTIGYVDIDNFKPLNDTHGHAAGDHVLREVAASLRAQLRAGDLAARIGGDEFGLVIVDADVKDAEEVGARLVSACMAAFAGFSDIGLGVTVGLVTFHDPSDATADMLAQADRALYRGKREGRNRVVVERAASPLAG